MATSILFLSDVVSNTTSYRRGQKASVADDEAVRLIMSGVATKAVPTSAVLTTLANALATDLGNAGYRAIPSTWSPTQPLPSGWTIPPSGFTTPVPSGYVLPSGAYRIEGETVHLVTPAGVRVSFDLLGLRP